MDGFRRRTIKNITMWTEVDGWTDGRKFVRRGLVRTCSKPSELDSVAPFDGPLRDGFVLANQLYDISYI